MWPATHAWFNLIPCGSELAREGRLTVDVDVDSYGLIASKLAPTFDLWPVTHAWFNLIPCGSELARDSGLTVEADVDW
ncbi:hypothetical protein EMIT0P253_280005 [Pseudomonas sp. IT-P253]